MFAGGAGEVSVTTRKASGALTGSVGFGLVVTTVAGLDTSVDAETSVAGAAEGTTTGVVLASSGVTTGFDMTAGSDTDVLLGWDGSSLA